tara:strand:+ start:133 stop:330 length:198 start_codon:yes stop_codon:yes gene_type:complete
LTSLKHRTAFSFFLPGDRLAVWLLARADRTETGSAGPDYPAEAKTFVLLLQNDIQKQTNTRLNGN